MMGLVIYMILDLALSPVTLVPYRGTGQAPVRVHAFSLFPLGAWVPAFAGMTQD